MPRFAVAFALSLSLVIQTPDAAADIPASWRDVGSVQQWRDLDSHFFRIHGLTGTPGPRIFDFEQKAVYEETWRHDSQWPRLDLAAFVALPPQERETRADDARRHLRQIRDLRLRLADVVMRIKGQFSVDWGTREGDYTALGNALARLHTAVGIDPTNAYAWHLLSYFATAAGDQQRALLALEGADAALAALPDTALVEVRSRITLDRAWLLRDLGHLGEASDALRSVASGTDRAVERRVLEGLLAAQSGDLNRAFRVAGDLTEVEVPYFPQDWESGSTLAPAILDPQGWPRKPSSHLRAWVLATAWLVDGRSDQATKAFPEFSLDRHYGLGQRFVNEAAAIYEITGRTELARKWWGMAHQYIPFQPYLVFKPYSLDVARLTGRPGALPFMLGYDTFLQTGSRLAYGMALTSQALGVEDRTEQVRLAGLAAEQFEICLRARLEVPAAALGLGYAQAVLGNAYEMLRAADAGLSALPSGPAEDARRASLTKIRSTALAVDRPALMGPGLGWQEAERLVARGETPAAAGLRLQAAYARDKADDGARRALARWQIRYGDPAEATQLAELPLAAGDPETGDWILLLEIDRLRNDSARAADLLASLTEGRASQWPDARLWTLVGIIGQDHGLAGSRQALEYALELDPANEALRVHLDETRP